MMALRRVFHIFLVSLLPVGVVILALDFVQGSHIHGYSEEIGFLAWIANGLMLVAVGWKESGK